MLHFLRTAVMLLSISATVLAQKGAGGGSPPGSGGNRGSGGGGSAPGGGNRGSGAGGFPPQQQRPPPQQPQQQPKPPSQQTRPPPQQSHNNPPPQQSHNNPQPQPKPNNGAGQNPFQGNPQPRPVDSNPNQPWQNQPKPGNSNPNQPWQNQPKPGNSNPNQPWQNQPRPGNGNGNPNQPWQDGRGGRDGGWRGGREPTYITINNGGDWGRGSRGYEPPRYITSYVPVPAWEIPFVPLISIQGPTLAIPRPGCSQVPTTQHTVTVTEATYTSTITDMPADGIITVYYGDDGQLSTYGTTVYYEVYIYTTTQSIDIIGSGIACGINWGKRTAAPLPTVVMARATPTAVLAEPAAFAA